VSIALLVMTDGRGELLARALASFDAMVTGPITRRVIHDDSGDDGYRAWLRATYPGYELVTTPARSGFGGAYASAWAHMAKGPERLTFGLEDDFLITRSIDLAEMAAVLDANPHLLQMALRRQPWNDVERAAGGVVEQRPGAFTEVQDEAGRAWLEHREWLTTNPSLYRRSLCAMGWPDVPRSEGEFTHYLLRHGTWVERVLPDAVRFGYWGSRDSGVWCQHTGHERVGHGY
jgi:hypothetical protein